MERLNWGAIKVTGNIFWKFWIFESESVVKVGEMARI